MYISILLFEWAFNLLRTLNFSMLYGSDTSYTSSVQVLVVNQYILLVAVCWYGINCSRDGDHQMCMGNCELSSKLWTVKY